MYELIYSKRVVKVLKKLPKKQQEHILSVLERTRIRPENYFTRLVGEKTYKLRAGDYRVIADISKEKLNILIIKIGHRKNVYK